MISARGLYQNIKSGLKSFSTDLTVLVNSLILTIAYFLGVGIPAIVAKIIGKSFLRNKNINPTKSYWSDLNLKKKPIDEYYRQF